MNQFSNSIMEFANSAVCSDLLPKAWNAIMEISPSRDGPVMPISCTCKASDPSNEKSAVIIAFVASPAASTLKNLQGEEEKQSLVDSSGTNFPLFEFLCTKVNPSVSINKAAIDHFASLRDQLSELRDKIDSKRPLIITGLSLGGSIASLFTLWLLDTIYLETSKLPLCITFGSPLLGDNAFQQAISERPKWISCFLHVISNQDPNPRFLVSSGHMPFGTTLFLSESGCACFEEPKSVLELINAMSLGNHEDSQIIDYGGLLIRLKYNAIRKGTIQGVDKCDLMSNPLQAGITLQLLAIGDMKQDNCERSALITKIRKAVENSQRRKRNPFDQTKKLNEIKIYMAYMGWYKKVSKDQGGYYDCYKNAWSKSSKEVKRKEEIVRHQRILNQYWKHMVAEIERMPETEGASKILARWLYGGTTYRRMVEPLDIAEYYRQGKTDYRNKGRSEHYKLLEQWEKGGSSNKPAKRNKVSSLTEDSCFWARVEEALIVCGLLKNGDDDCPENKEALSGNLIEFEKYVMGLIGKLSVSLEIFVEESSFMKWWKDYKQIKGISYQSDLTAFMNNEKLESESIMLDDYKKLS